MIFTIRLENMEFRAAHGCYDLEKRVGNRFLVSVEIEAESEVAAREDDVQKAVNYLNVYEVVAAQMRITSNILENVALRICDAIRAEWPQVESVRVELSKLAPPLGGKIEKVTVGVTR